MVRWMVAAALAFLPGVAHAQAEQQALVDRATLAAQEMVNNLNGRDAQGVLKQARAVMICPQVLRAGFLFGGQGGNCVLVARDGAGSWSAPAFYTLGGASFGFQAGLQDAQVMLIIMSDRGLHAVLDSQFKLGADATATFADLGGGVEGGTTAALRADVVGFSKARGLYAGITLGGSIMSSRSDWNQIYYGRPLAAQQIVVGMEATNPAADPLRQVLMRYGTPNQPPQAPALPPPVPQGSAPGNAPGPYAPAPYPPSSYVPARPPVTQQPLRPAGRY